MAKIDVVCPRCSKTLRAISTSGAQLYRCKLFQLSFQYNAAKPNSHQSIIDMAMNGSGYRDTARVLDISLNTVLRHQKLESKQRAQHVAAEIVICCEANEPWSFVRCKHNPRWLFYAIRMIAFENGFLLMFLSLEMH